MKYFAVYILFLFTFHITLAQRASVLWEISGNKLAKKSYLLGSNHAASAKLLAQYPQITRAIKSCDYSLFEIYGEAIGNTEPREQDTTKASPLDKIFSPTEYAMVDSFFTATELGSIKPHNNDASLAGMLRVIVVYQENKGKQLFEFDSYIKEIVDSLKKPVFHLDDPNDPFAKSYASSYKMLATMIVALLKDNPDLRLTKQYDDTLNFDMLLHTQAIGMTREGTLNRNRVWLPKVISKIQTGSCFITVGLDHLRYKTGLINLLRGKGYILKPVPLRKGGV